MGTNYYFRVDLCDHCGRHNKIHVGKSSAGWSFSFRAWPHKLWNEEHPDWGYDPESPFGSPVMSRVDWRRVFAKVRGQLWDEYGRQVDDPTAWLEALTPPDPEQQRWEDGNRDPRWRRDPDEEWRDAEGFRLNAGEFS